MEVGEDPATRAGLAAAAIAGDEADAAQVEEVREADVEFPTAGGKSSSGAISWPKG